MVGQEAVFPCLLGKGQEGRRSTGPDAIRARGPLSLSLSLMLSDPIDRIFGAFSPYGEKSCIVIGYTMKNTDRHGGSPSATQVFAAAWDVNGHVKPDFYVMHIDSGRRPLATTNKQRLQDELPLPLSIYATPWRGGCEGLTGCRVCLSIVSTYSINLKRLRLAY